MGNKAVSQHKRMASGDNVSQSGDGAFGRQQFKEGGKVGFKPHKDSAYKSSGASLRGFKKGGRAR